MADKRQIRGEKYNVSELVQNAIAAADSKPIDLEKARYGLRGLGNTNPSDELLARYARELAICEELARTTGAYGFTGQVGKIDFSSTENAISDVNAYLSRRNNANHQRWTARRGY